MKKLGIAVMTSALAVLVITCSKSGATPEEQLLSQIPNSENKVKIDASQMELELLSLVNQHRKSAGSGELYSSPEAYKYAADHNAYMIAQNQLSHDNFDARAAQIAGETGAVAVSENVARHYDTASLALQGWLNSSSHKRTLEGNFTHTALSVTLDKEGRPYITQIFLKIE